MKNSETDTFSFFDVPIAHFPDKSTRYLLEDPYHVKGLLEIADENLLEQIDWNQLKQVSRSSIADNLREQESDLIYTVPLRGGAEDRDLSIYILIEHQSTVDPTMSRRILSYMARVWEAQDRKWDEDDVPIEQRRLQPVVPILLYTGDRRWTVSLDLKDRMDAPEIADRFTPKFDTLFLSVKHEAIGHLTKTDHPFGWLMTVLQKEHASKADLETALIAALSHINQLPDDKREQWRRAISYISLLILHRRPAEEHDALNTLVQDQIEDESRKKEASEMSQSMAEQTFQQGEERGERRGERRGEMRAQRKATLRVLQQRFGNVPEALVRKINAMRSIARLDAIFNKALEAETLEDIDWENV